MEEAPDPWRTEVWCSLNDLDARLKRLTDDHTDRIDGINGRLKILHGETEVIREAVAELRVAIGAEGVGPGKFTIDARLRSLEARKGWSNG